MKGTCPYACGGGVVPVKFTGATKFLANSKYLNTLVTSTISKARKKNNKSKAKDKYDSDPEYESEKFNSENPYI